MSDKECSPSESPEPSRIIENSDSDENIENFEDFIDRNNDHTTNIDNHWETYNNSNEDKQNQIGDEQMNDTANVMLNCWYCNKKFEKGPIYDEH